MYFPTTITGNVQYDRLIYSLLSHAPDENSRQFIL